MNRQIIFTLLAMLLMPLFGFAARVDTVMVKAPAMQREVKVIYVIPDKAEADNRCPVVYLLHGHNGKPQEWINRKPELRQIADAKHIIFVCPDGNNSWYWDSPRQSDFRYETFISKELVEYTDSHFATIADRAHRAITGLSMGGHGALWNAIRHKDVFGAVGAMSGGVDIRPFPEKWHMKERLGTKDENPEIWNSHTVMTAVDTLQNGELAIIFDCGTADFFHEINEALHRRLLELGIDHDYIVRPGAHNWAYWGNSLEYQILFFHRYFSRE